MRFVTDFRRVVQCNLAWSVNTQRALARGEYDDDLRAWALPVLRGVYARRDGPFDPRYARVWSRPRHSAWSHALINARWAR